MIILIFYLSRLSGQEFCHTTGGGSGSIGAITESISNGITAIPPGPYYIRVYVHVIRHLDGSGGQTDEAIRNAFEILNSDFNPHNIFFVRTCDVIDVPVSEEDYYDFNIYCDLWGNPQYQHDDGIDMFLGPEEVTNNAGGIAANIPSKALWVAGIWTNSVDIPAIQSPIISHEMGHCLGLWHTFHGTVTEGGNDCDGNPITGPPQCCELVNGSNGNTCGDYVDDTDADGRGWYLWGINPYCENFAWHLINFSPNCTTINPITGEHEDQNGHVYTPLRNNIMSYLPNMLCIENFTLGQGDRMRQVIAFSPILQACLVHADFTNPEITITTIWTPANTPNNGNVLISGDLIIESGATLTIGAGVTVSFEEDSRLIIKPNGQLALNGKLTGMGCGFSWEGIEIWGNSTSSQYTVSGVNAQGRLYGSNGSVIENAKTAVKLYGPNYAQNAGGVINCIGTAFLNCPIGIEFAPYQNFWPYSSPPGQTGQPSNYSGSFTKCDFTVDDDYPHDEPFYAFVHMTGVNGVKISGCTFNNNMNIDGDEIADWGYGIFANDAGFTVGAKCEGPAPPYPLPCQNFSSSKFNNLGYGIYTAIVVNNRPYQVRQSDFNNCFVGIRNKGVSGGTLLHNNFNLGAVPSSVVSIEQSGICFEIGIAGFTCQENEFTNISGTDEITTIGIFCDNTGDFGKTIRKNTFDGLVVGNLAKGQNGANPNVTQEVRGLNYLCNRNFDALTDDGADFDVASGWVRGKQGLVNPNSTDGHDAAGNRFSYTGTDFINSGQGDIEYFYYEPGANQVPMTISGTLIPTEAPENDCPTEYCEPPCREPHQVAIIKSEYYARKSDYLAAKADYLVTPTEELLLEMAGHRHAMDEATYMVVIHQLYDTVDYNQDTLLVWIDNMDCIASELWASALLFAHGDTTSALQLLDNLPNEYDLSSDEQTDLQSYHSIASILEGKSFYELDGATLASISNFDQSGGNAGGWAQNILTMYGAHYPPSYLFSDGIGERSVTENVEEKNESRRAESNLTVLPNPASNFVQFHLDSPVEREGAMLVIRDLRGKEVKFFELNEGDASVTWHTSQNPGGIYFYQLMMKRKSQQSGKIILIK